MAHIIKKGPIKVPTQPKDFDLQATGLVFKSYDNQIALEFNVMQQDGTPADLLGANLRLLMFIYDEVDGMITKEPIPFITENLITESFLNGQVVYILPEAMKAYNGMVEAYVYIEYPDGSTSDNLGFTFRMKRSAIDGLAQDKADYFIEDFKQLLAAASLEANKTIERLTEHVNQKITEYDQYIASGKSDWEDFVNQNREIIESVDPGGVILGELIDSRGDFTNLADRLNKKDELLSNLSFGKNFIFDEKFGVSAHRGSTSTAPENTLKSIREAARLGYELVEIDVQLTSDNELILMHDATVDRTTNGTGDVKDLTLEQIKSLVVDIDFAGKNTDESIKIPTFEEAVSLCSRLGLGINIDCSKKIWDVETFGLMVDIINKHNMMKRVFFVITDEAQRMTLLNEYPFIAITWLNNSLANLTNNIDFCRKYTNAFVSYPTSLITEIAIAELRKNNIPIHIYGTSTFNDIFKWQGKGIRFVETDNFIGLGD